MKKKIKKRLLLLFTILIGVLVISPMIGSMFIGWDILFSSDILSSARIIFIKTRIPRLLLSLLVGSSLACSGAVFQSVFRNGLATPFTLGTASGGAFGAVLAITFGINISFFGFSTIMLFAFAGSLLSLFIVFSLGRHRGGITTSTMLLAGVTVGFFFSALTMFFHYILDYTSSHQMLIWTMGSLDITEYGSIIKIAPVITIGMIFILRMGSGYNQLCLGEEAARMRGVDVEKLKRRSFIVTSLMIGTSVSVAGPIGFVGLVVPHVMRLIIGGDYRILLPATILGGGAFLVICDTIARTIISPSEIPVGVITAMVGGPFFLFLLVRKSAERF